MIDGGLRALFRQHLPAYHWVSIETGGTGRGIPDSEYCVGGMTAWVEYKVTDGWAVTLRPEQVAWMLRRSRAGGRVWVVVRRKAAAGPRRGGAVDELWILRGMFADEIREQGLPKIQLLEIGTDIDAEFPQHHYVVRAWAGGPARWSWDHIDVILRSEHAQNT